MSTTAEEHWYIVRKCADHVGLPVRLTGITMFTNCLWSNVSRTIGAALGGFTSEYMEGLRTYDPDSWTWGSMWKETQRKRSGEDAGLTNSQVCLRAYLCVRVCMHVCIIYVRTLFMHTYVCMYVCKH